MTTALKGLDSSQELLIKLVEQSPEDWTMRKKVVQALFDTGYHREASKILWDAPEIPLSRKDFIFVIRVIARGQPARAMRLMNKVIAQNQSRPNKILEMAKTLASHGLLVQAVRFYGAAVAADNSLIDEDFELCLIASDREQQPWHEVAEGRDFPWEKPAYPDPERVGDLGQTEMKAASEALMSSVTSAFPVKSQLVGEDQKGMWRVEAAGEQQAVEGNVAQAEGSRGGEEADTSSTVSQPSLTMEEAIASPFPMSEAMVQAEPEEMTVKEVVVEALEGSGAVTTSTDKPKKLSSLIKLFQKPKEESDQGTQRKAGH